MEKTADFRLILVTTDSPENAKLIATMLIMEKLAVCCSITNNVTSLYEWDNKITESNESIILIKSTEEKLEILEKRILEIHNYEVPEIISIKIDSANPSYYNWALDTLKK